MPDPILHYLFPFDRPASELGRWHQTSDYFVWNAVRPSEQAPLTIWELYPQGAVRIPDNDRVMHIVKGGTPHHIEHLFGYWRVCDADIIAVRNVQPDGVYHALVLGGCPGAYNKDAIQWVCPKCANTLARFEVSTGRQGWENFWAEEKRRVADFNSDAKLRTCRSCSFEHPFAFVFDPNNDSPAEAAARKAW